MKKKFLYALMGIFICASAYSYEEAGALSQLVGSWRPNDARNSVKQIFDFTLYDEYRDLGFIFSKTAKNYAKQLSGKNTFEGYSQIEFKADGSFNAIDAVFSITSGKKASSNAKTYSGSWKADGQTLYLSYVYKSGEEIINADASAALTVTAEFSYLVKSSELTLFPKFNKKSAYSLLEEYLKSPSRLYGLRDFFYGVLSNSQSSLSAYSVKRVIEAIEQINQNPSSVSKNMRFIKNITQQWLDGKAGLAVEKVPKRVLSKRIISGKWYYKGEKQENFTNLITPVMPCALQEIPLLLRRDDKKENYSEIDLRYDGSVFMHSFFTNVNNDTETYVVDLEGVWELEGNTVSMRFNKLKHIDSGRITMQETNLFYSFRGTFSADGRFIISKNMPSVTGYVNIKDYIKNARTKQQYFPFDAIPEMLNDKYSSLYAYDISRMKRLINIINESMPEKKKKDVNQACDEMDAIADRWYEEYARYNK
ncbi:MAG: hypothetical protein LBU09_04485 [Endomicrobium sp.]|jgi:hypothetical protein|nr:hypothetical protein [Endomicrobium sp.]